VVNPRQLPEPPVQVPAAQLPPGHTQVGRHCMPPGIRFTQSRPGAQLSLPVQVAPTPPPDAGGAAQSVRKRLVGWSRYTWQAQPVGQLALVVELGAQSVVHMVTPGMVVEPVDTVRMHRPPSPGQVASSWQNRRHRPPTHEWPAAQVVERVQVVASPPPN